jgi:hypothetical protein
MANTFCTRYNTNEDTEIYAKVVLLSGTHDFNPEYTQLYTITTHELLEGKRLNYNFKHINQFPIKN